MAFSESVEVNEELFDSDSVSCNLRSKSLLDIKLNVEHWVSLRVDARVGYTKISHKGLFTQN